MINMKKVLFVIGNMDVGGTRVSLINLLNNLTNTKNIDFYICILSGKGKLIESIPNNIKIIKEDYLISSITNPFNSQKLKVKLLHILIKLLTILFGYKKTYSKFYKRYAKIIRDNYGEFDAVFGYQEGMSNDFAIEIFSKKKYTWIHSNLEVWYNKQDFIIETYKKSDKILFVSQVTQNNFCLKFNEFKGKCMVIHNTIVQESIKKLSSNKIKDNLFESKKNDEIVFISVGRICKEKAYNRIPKIARKILDKKITNFKWYIIGNGELLSELKKEIKTLKVEKNVILLGEKTNPYKYIKKSNFLVITSITESYPMVILESLTLGTPVITTRFSSTDEIFSNNKYAVICENNEYSLEKTIIDIIKNEKIRNELYKYSKSYKYDCTGTINSFLELI